MLLSYNRSDEASRENWQWSLQNIPTCLLYTWGKASNKLLPSAICERDYTAWTFLLEWKTHLCETLHGVVCQSCWKMHASLQDYEKALGKGRLFPLIMLEKLVGGICVVQAIKTSMSNLSTWSPFQTQRELLQWTRACKAPSWTWRNTVPLLLKSCDLQLDLGRGEVWGQEREYEWYWWAKMGQFLLTNDCRRGSISFPYMDKRLWVRRSRSRAPWKNSGLLLNSWRSTRVWKFALPSLKSKASMPII